MKQARMVILDEMSMIGRQMLGKICFKVADALRCEPGPSCALTSMGGRDVILAGDPKQAKAIGDEALHKDGPYTKKGLNKPKDKNGRWRDPPPGSLDLAGLVALGLAFRQEFDDVVFLERKHRLSTGTEGMTALERAEYDAMSPERQREYEADGERFAQVCDRLGALSWTGEDRDWLAQRDRRALLSQKDGEAEVRKFDEAPLLMDTRVQRIADDEPGEKSAKEDLDGADKMNLQLLRELARRTGVPIACFRSHYKKAEGCENMRVDLMEDGDFAYGLKGELQLCVGARVLLTKNEWVEAGLCNGALGVVKGFVWPAGGTPTSEDPRLKAPICVIVEFDELDMGYDVVGTDAAGQPVKEPRNFFPELGAEGRKCVPIFRAEAEAGSDRNVVRQQFPLTLAWALTHWKAQGMTLKRARIRIGRNVAGQPGVAFVAITRVGHPSHLMFDTDLPDFDTFDQAKYKEEFRSRERYELRLKARASDTASFFPSPSVNCAQVA